MNSLIKHVGEVTPEWLTSVLERSGYLDQGKVITVNKRQSLRQGLTSDRFHLEIDYADKVSKSAPVHLFLKIGKPEFFEGHKKEIDFYRISEDVWMDLPIPRCFDAEYSSDSKTSYLLLQDLSKTHFELDTPIPPTKANCERAIECLAKLHAFWWSHPRLGNDVGESITRDSFNQIIKYLEECTALFLDFVGDRLSKKRHELYEFVLSSYPSLYLKCIDRGVPVTLIHGDAHLRNFMFPDEIGTDATLLLDWQVWRVDFGTRDLASMMALNWYPDQRQIMEKSLLVHYHNKLLESDVTKYGWEECWLGYRVSAISNLFVPVLYFDYKISPVIWWPLLEKGFLAFQDLQCSELLDT